MPIPLHSICFLLVHFEFFLCCSQYIITIVPSITVMPILLHSICFLLVHFKFFSKLSIYIYIYIYIYQFLTIPFNSNLTLHIALFKKQLYKTTRNFYSISQCIFCTIKLFMQVIKNPQHNVVREWIS